MEIVLRCMAYALLLRDASGATAMNMTVWPNSFGGVQVFAQELHCSYCCACLHYIFVLAGAPGQLAARIWRSVVYRVGVSILASLRLEHTFSGDP